jgi:flagellar protein FlaG
MELNNVTSLFRVKPVGQPVSGSPSRADQDVRIEGLEKQTAPTNNDAGTRETERAFRREAQAKPSAEEQQATAEALNAASEAKAKMAPLVMHSVSFQVDDSTGETVINVINAETKEVIRTIPPEELRQIAQNLDNIDIAPKGGMVDREG